MFIPLRAEGPRARPGAPRPRAPVTLAVVALNLAAFAGGLALVPQARAALPTRFGLVPSSLAHAGDPLHFAVQLAAVVTSLFLHGSVWHLAGNLWFLWLFGAPLEVALGSVRFVAFYFGSGLLAGALQIAAAPTSPLPIIGASGAIAGVLGGYALCYPWARVRCLVVLVFVVTFATVPAPLLLGTWLVLQVAAARHGAPGVAWFAHIGGFFGGLVLAARVRPRARARESCIIAA
jgi:membrane associated rhomboid family serine protease